MSVISPAREARVLLVDDTPDLRLLLRLVIEDCAGLDVVGECGDGRTAIELARSLTPDVVLLDLAMPVMDGLEALPHIRAVAPGAHVVVLSGFEAAALQETALAAGASAYVAKGAAPAQILETVASVLGRDLPAQRQAPAPPEPGGPSAEEIKAALRMAAHELRSPVTVLVGLAETLARRGAAADPLLVEQMVDAIIRQSDRLQRITDDLLAESEADAGTMTVRSARFALAPVIDRAVTMAADRQGVDVRCDADISVHADPVRVEQMVGNLVTNALKYGAPPFTVAVERAAQDVVVRVVDAGGGVPADFEPRLFERYARAAGLRAPGTGLGLYVVRSLAEAQGGRAWHERPAGGGAALCFSLPSTCRDRRDR